MNKMYKGLVLAFFLVAADAQSIQSKSVLFSKLANARLVPSNWEGLGLVSNVNEYVDNTISMLIPFIEQNGLDPMTLPDVEEGFEVKPLLITYSARLKIHGGYMRGLVNVARSGDQMVSYFAKMLRIQIKLQFTDLEFYYNYLVKVMNIGPTGGIRASLARFVVTVDLLFDFNNDEIHLQEFSLTDIGRLRVRLTGNILVDWLVNPVVNVFVSIFDNIIMKVVESNIRSAAQDLISLLNSNIKDAIYIIENM